MVRTCRPALRVLLVLVLVAGVSPGYVRAQSGAIAACVADDDVRTVSDDDECDPSETRLTWQRAARQAVASDRPLGRVSPGAVVSGRSKNAPLLSAPDGASAPAVSADVVDVTTTLEGAERVSGDADALDEPDDVRFVDYFAGATFMGVDTGCSNGGAVYAAGTPPALAYACRRETASSTAVSADGPCAAAGRRFADCGNGTVTDQATRLIWLQRADCLPVLDYADAKQAAHDLRTGDCGLSDHSSEGQWRLPTSAEWSTIISPAQTLHCESPLLTDATGTACYSDAAASNVWSGVASAPYWARSATPFGSGETRDLGSGTSLMLVSNPPPARVWPVRGGRP